MNVSTPPAYSTTEPAVIRLEHAPRYFVRVIAIALAFAAALGVWHCCNHALPAPDDSSYILDSFKYADLLHHPKFWKPDWWHAALTVNQAYPPTVMVFNGILRLVLGFGNWVNILSVMIFSLLLTFSTFGATAALTGDKRAGLIAAVTVNLYPEVWCVNHLFALDAPLISMISCGLFALFWWRARPSLLRAIACGVILGLACLTKQIAAAYLIWPAGYCFVEAFIKDLRTRKINLTAQLMVVAALTAAVFLPWWLTNLEFIRNWAADNQTTMGHLKLYEVFPQRVYWYLCSIPSIMSPLLLAAFLLALLPLTKREMHLPLLPAALSAVGGVAMISTLTWAFPSLRYDAPVLIVTAAYTGAGASLFWDKSPVRVSSVLIAAAAALQYASFNFTPYPISQPSWLSRISEVLGVRVVELFGLTEHDRRGSDVLHANPSPPQDWGHEWCIRTIDSVQGHVPVFLNILPDIGALNGNTFELQAHMLGSLVRPTTSRRWTVMGDAVSFDPKVAQYYQWYLLKTGFQGNIFRDDESLKQYNQLTDYVMHSGRFRLIGTHRIADGSLLSLYQQQ